MPAQEDGPDACGRRHTHIKKIYIHTVVYEDQPLPGGTPAVCVIYMSRG